MSETQNNTRETLPALLNSIEWCVPVSEDADIKTCPMCKRTESSGHAEDCAMSNAIKLLNLIADRSATFFDVVRRMDIGDTIAGLPGTTEQLRAYDELNDVLASLTEAAK